MKIVRFLVAFLGSLLYWLEEYLPGMGQQRQPSII